MAQEVFSVSYRRDEKDIAISESFSEEMRSMRNNYVLQNFLEQKGFFRLQERLCEMIDTVTKMAKNTKDEKDENAFSHETSHLKPDKYSYPSRVSDNILVLDIGGTHTKVAYNKNGETSIILDEDNNFFAAKSLGLYDLDLENFIDVVAKETKARIGVDCNIEAIAIVWSNTIEAQPVMNEKYEGITGTTIGVGGDFYQKGEWFISGLTNGYDLGDAFHKIFDKNEIPVRTLLMANDTVFTLKALPNADSGVVISSGSNATMLGKDGTILNTEMGAMILLNDRYLSDIDLMESQFLNRYSAQYICSGKWQNIFLRNYVVEAGKAGIQDLERIATDLAEGNFLRTEDISETLNGRFPYRDKYPEAEEAFLKICEALINRGALVGAILVYSSIVNELDELEDGKRVNIALDSAMARHMPGFFNGLKDNLKKIMHGEDKVNIVLLEPQNGVPVPILGAVNAIKRYA